MTSMQVWPAAERNKQPILEVLKRFVPSSGVLLEIGSGTGQHASFFARALGLTIQPSDIDEANLASIRAYVDEAGRENLRPPIALDVRRDDWGVDEVDVIFSANMIHIAPWECAEGLFRGARRVLRQEGLFVLYGPFRVDGQHTAPSNAAFDESLKARNASWGVRELRDIEALASAAGLSLLERVAMPANNQTLMFERVR